MSTLNEQVARAVGWDTTLSVPDAEHDLAMAWRAYEVVRAQGWHIYSVCDHTTLGRVSIGLFHYVTHAAADATGATFPAALCAAIVKAAERSEDA